MEYNFHFSGRDYVLDEKAMLRNIGRYRMKRRIKRITTATLLMIAVALLSLLCSGC